MNLSLRIANKHNVFITFIRFVTTECDNTFTRVYRVLNLRTGIGICNKPVAGHKF
jgi:hypothetical protein